MPYRPGVELGDAGVPETFGKVWADPHWRAAFVDWASQQPDWSGHLITMLDRIGGFRLLREPIADDARAVLRPFLLACPPLDIALYRDARRAAVSPSQFDRAYVAAYQVLTNNKHVLAAFRTAVDDCRRAGVTPTEGLAPVGPLGIWSNPSAAR